MPTPTRLSRPDLLILIKQHLESAAPHGLSRSELLTAIGRPRTSLATIQRVLDHLRSAHDAQIRYDARDRRWHIDAPLPLPLDAPDRDDLLAVLIAQAILEPYLDANLRDRLGKLVEEIDQRARTRTASTDLPAGKSMTSTLTFGTRIDPEILRRLILACRRTPMRVRYASPWNPPTDGAKWQEIEPWALRVHDGAVYLRAWAPAQQLAKTYRLPHFEAVEPIDAAAPRHTPPADIWGDESPAFGIDRDRPGTAVIRLRGSIARWAASTIWHPDQKDVLLDNGEILERTLAYRSCRELARRLASMSDGFVSIEPKELRDEIRALGLHAAALPE